MALNDGGTHTQTYEIANQNIHYPTICNPT
jgi:hypothetical protein